MAGSSPTPEGGVDVRGRNGIANFFIGAGFLLLIAGVLAKTSAQTGGRLAGSILSLIGAIWLVVGLGVRLLYARMSARAEAEESLFDSGTKAIATVHRVEATGLILNGVNSQVILHLSVHPPAGPDFAHVRKVYVPFNALPRTGDVIDVAYDPADSSKVALATDWSFDSAGGHLLETRQSGGAGAAAEAGHGPTAVIEALERLHRLKSEGALSEAEFEQQKAKLLAEPDPLG